MAARLPIAAGAPQQLGRLAIWRVVPYTLAIWQEHPMPHLELVTQPPAPQAPDISREEAQAMQRAIVSLFAKWGLSDDEACTLLGGIGLRTFSRWKVGDLGRTSVDLQARMSNLLGIHKALRLLFDDPVRGYGWIKRPNTAFGDLSALQVMLGGQLTDLMRVRRYLDAQRGVW
jgi:hypothetical protein